MSNRDEFPAKIRKAVAARAGWRCSFAGCQKLTVGPSEESSLAITSIGVAAHICAAARGIGSRRYVASMTPEERAGVDNAVWLCADHAILIDRDEIFYSIEMLRKMKREHEASCAQVLRTGANPDLGIGLLAVGPHVVFTGDIADISATNWTLRLRHPVVGDVHTLISFIDGFANAAVKDKYVLSNELGDGRVLSEAPTLTKQNDGYFLRCPVAPGVPRIDAQKIGSGLAVSPETNDLYLDANGNIARVSGLDYFPQKVQSLLSMQQGENVFAPTAGARFFEYYEAFKDTPWLALLMKLDVVRQAAIPFDDKGMSTKHAPLRCVNRVRGIQLMAETPTNNRLPVRVDFEVQGVGHWQHELSVYIPTREQMTARAKLIAETGHLR